MQFVDRQVSRHIEMGAQRTSSWDTTIIQSDGGGELSIQNWNAVRQQFDISFSVRTAADYDAVVQHFHTMRGRAKKFPFRDFLDNSATVQRGVLVPVTPFTAYRLAKTYGDGADAYQRRITRPVAGTVAVFRTRVGTTTNITASCTITAGTGAVAITSGTVIAGDTLAWSGSFLVPVRYDTDRLPAAVPAMAQSGELLVTCDSIVLIEVRE